MSDGATGEGFSPPAQPRPPKSPDKYVLTVRNVTRTAPRARLQWRGPRASDRDSPMHRRASAPMPPQESPSVSDVTLAEYNRWVVERENKQIAEERRADMERERSVRAKMDEEWKARGLARFQANKDQLSVSRASVEQMKKSNLDRGTAVKDEKQQWKQQHKNEMDGFLSKSQQAVKDLGSDLKQKVAEEKKNMTERNRQVGRALRLTSRGRNGSILCCAAPLRLRSWSLRRAAVPTR